MIGSLLFFGLYPLSRLINWYSEQSRKNDTSSLIDDQEVSKDECEVDSSMSLHNSRSALLYQWLRSPPRSAPLDSLESGDGEGTVGEPEKTTQTSGKDGELQCIATGDDNKVETSHAELEEDRGTATKDSPIQLELSNRPEEMEKEEEVVEKEGKVVEKEVTVDDLTKSPLTPRQGREVEAVRGEGIILKLQNANATDYCRLSWEPLAVHAEDVVSMATEPHQTDKVTELLDEHFFYRCGEVHARKCCPDHGSECSEIKVGNTHPPEDVVVTGSGEMHAGTCGPVLDLVSRLSRAQVQPWEAHARPPRVGWHFPVGPGLAERLYCPSWQEADISYYPALKDSSPFEVEWRVWEDVRQSPTAAAPGCPQLFDFTVMSYNILSQNLLEVNQHLYSHCPPEVLEWNYRYSLLLGEIGKWRPDEVQENHYNEQLHPDLCDMGYTCVYKKRTGGKTDGCAVGYRADRFRVKSESLLEFLRPETNLLDRDNVGIVLLLQPISIQESQVTPRGWPLCVASTHLLFNPGRGDVKLAQLAVVLAEIHRAVRSCRGRYNVVLCGDFNSVPHQPLYDFITTGKLRYQGMPAWQVSGQQDMSMKHRPPRMYAPLWPSALGITDSCQYAPGAQPPEHSTEERDAGKIQYDHEFMRQFRFCPLACVRPHELVLIPGVTDNTPDPPGEQPPPFPNFRGSISHFLELRSAYTHSLGAGRRPGVTTLHRESANTVDYIFYTSAADCSTGLPPDGRLRLAGRLSLLSEEDLWSMKGLPNETFPSDHLSLLVRFHMELQPE